MLSNTLFQSSWRVIVALFSGRVEINTLILLDQHVFLIMKTMAIKVCIIGWSVAMSAPRDMWG